MQCFFGGWGDGMECFFGGQGVMEWNVFLLFVEKQCIVSLQTIKKTNIKTPKKPTVHPSKIKSIPIFNYLVFQNVFLFLR